LSKQGATELSEAQIQAIVQENPSCLPIAEIDPIFSGPIPVCTELNTSAGPIDNFMITPTGLPILVECKLWRNPEARREVVGQILDYAKELSRWSSSDLQREVSRRLKRSGNPILDIVRTTNPTIDEVQFNDALTVNLRRGRFLLLIVGDGIREGVEAIAEYIQRHASLHFSLGLIELPIYVMPNDDYLVTPRVLARTMVITRTVVILPEGHVLQENSETPDADIDPERDRLQDEQQRFWSEFLSYLKLDDPEQQVPRPARQGFLAFGLPAPAGSSWLTVYRDIQKNEVGIFLSSTRSTAGEHAVQVIVNDWDVVGPELGGTAKLTDRKGRPTIIDSRKVDSLRSPDLRKEAFAWLAERTNVFVSVIRPRIRSAVADYQDQGD